MKNFTNYTIHKETRCLEALKKLDQEQSNQTLFVLDEKEIDFVAEKMEKKLYIQVAYKMTGQSTAEREFSPLLSIRDNHPKYLVAMEENWHDNIEGIQHKHIADFILMKDY